MIMQTITFSYIQNMHYMFLIFSHSHLKIKKNTEARLLISLWRGILDEPLLGWYMELPRKDIKICLLKTIFVEVPSAAKEPECYSLFKLIDQINQCLNL